VTADEPGETADGAGVTAAAPAGRVGHLHHQPALDGVRGLAVLAVVVLHAGPASWLPGGFLGVSLFFTLSGYLITSLLLRRADTGVDVPAFWRKRIRRLLPASLVTIATPHRGTPLADAGARLVRGSRVLSASLGSVLDLTTERMRVFEAETPDVCTVQYASIAVSPGRGARGVGPWLLPTYRWLRRSAGDNDGVVPLASQRRGRVLGHLHADHWSAVGWGRFDAPSFYERLALELLAGRGLPEGPVAGAHPLLLGAPEAA